ncbi:hypothetical protein QBC44DRAFT_313457 [Cladorrhinum sp. PSN332]|nr:hypothetical protein QBC44DRAFT_313457 [Cladorrhinum sp. PSN332]
MSSPTEQYNIFTGIWTNWSKGKVMGWTLTLTRSNGNLVIAFLAAFIAFPLLILEPMGEMSTTDSNSTAIDSNASQAVAPDAAAQIQTTIEERGAVEDQTRRYLNPHPAETTLNSPETTSASSAASSSESDAISDIANNLPPPVTQIQVHSGTFSS